MNTKSRRILRNTAEEETEIARQIAENPDEAEWTDEDWANAKSTEELFPEAAKEARKHQAELDSGQIEYITLLLDRETINWLKTQTGEDGNNGGTKWLTLAENTLRDHARAAQSALTENQIPGG